VVLRRADAAVRGRGKGERREERKKGDEAGRGGEEGKRKERGRVEREQRWNASSRKSTLTANHGHVEVCVTRLHAYKNKP